MPLQVRHVLETCLYVRDLDDAERFYRDVLGLELHSRQAGRHVFLRCGSAMVLLFLAENTSSVPTMVGGAPIPTHGATGSGHVAFAVEERELHVWRETLANKNIEIESEVSWPNGGASIYVRDPSGNSIELATPSIWK